MRKARFEPARRKWMNSQLAAVSVGNAAELGGLCARNDDAKRDGRRQPQHFHSTSMICLIGFHEKAVVGPTLHDPH